VVLQYGKPCRRGRPFIAALCIATLCLVSLEGCLVKAVRGTPLPVSDEAIVPFTPSPAPPVLFTVLKTGKKLNRNWLGLNEFFPVHYWYSDILYRFGLHLRLSLEEKTLILAGLLFNLDFEHPVHFVVDEYRGREPLIVRLQLVEAEAGTAVLLWANVNPDNRTPIPDEKLLFHGYKQLYVLERSQLVSVWDLGAAGHNGRRPARGQSNGLGYDYIFDGDPDNDAEAERMLLLASENGLDAVGRLFSRLDLARLYGAHGRFAEAELAMASARLLLERELPNRQDLREATGMISEELLITRAVKELGSRRLDLGIPAL
jgi:hypothetical protein